MLSINQLTELLLILMKINIQYMQWQHFYKYHYTAYTVLWNLPSVNDYIQYDGNILVESTIG